MNVINIVEVCGEGSISNLYEYDILPQNVKGRVDEALKLENERTITCDMYKHGIQFLDSIKHETLLENKILEINFMGTVYFYHVY